MEKRYISTHEILNDKIKSHYTDKVCLLYSNDYSIFDEFYEIDIDKHYVYIFDTIEEIEPFIEENKINIVDNFIMLWINGEQDKSLIWKLRG